MFWQQQKEETSLDLLLKSENISVQAVLEDQYTLQEIRNSNKKLLDYLVREDVLMEIMNCALRPQIDSSLPLQLQYKHAHLCSEILSSNSDELGDAILSSEVVLSVISEFVDDTCRVNHLVASFYMKIVCQLLSKNADKMLEVLDNGHFVERCLENMQLSAVAELVLRLVSIPYDYEMGVRIREWYVVNNLVEGCISLLDPSFPSAVHDNVSYLWIELVRNMREVLYSSDTRQDPLLERMQKPEIIEELVGKMLKLDSCEGVCESVIVNVCQILVTMVETNFVPNSPSHQLADDKGENNWSGGMPGDPNSLDGQKFWQPDSERIIETIAASHADKMLRLTIEELQMEETGEAWLAMLQLIVQLCDTMHPATHASLLTAFRSEHLEKLFALAVERPTLSLLHKLLHKLVTYIIYTIGGTPLLSYLFEELDIVGVLSEHLTARCTLPLLPLICLRSFHSNLADSIERSSQGGPNKALLSEILEADSRWATVRTELTTYNEWNKPDPCIEPSSITTSGMRSDGEQDREEFFDAAQVFRIQEKKREFDSMQPTQLLPEVFEKFELARRTSGDEVDSIEKIDEPPQFDLDEKFRNFSVDESEFEKMCTMRASHEIMNTRRNRSIERQRDEDDEWPNTSVGANSTNNSFDTNNEWTASNPLSPPPATRRSGGGGGIAATHDDDWPSPGGTSSSASTTSQNSVNLFELKSNSQKASDPFATEWPTSSACNGSGGNVGPGPTSAGGEDDLWADFGSSRMAFGMSPAAANFPPSEAAHTAVSDEWPGEESEKDKNPVTSSALGFAHLIESQPATTTSAGGGSSDC